jgi:hypothetical protein
VERDEPFPVAYLVLSHRAPEQVEALANRIFALSPGGHVVVHHDARGGPPPWAGHPPARGHLVERTAVEWGDWSMVEAALRLVRYAATELEARWFALVSGDARPVVDLAAWEEEVRATGVDGLVSSRPIVEGPRWLRRPRGEDINYTRYHYTWTELPAARHRAARVGLESLRRASRFLQPAFKIEYTDRRRRWFLGIPRRRRALPGGAALYAGPQWVAFSDRAAAALVDADTELVAWYRRTWIPDQSFVQTVLGSTPGLRLRNEPFTFLPDPHRPVGPGSWMVVRVGDLEDVWASGCPFARKFDPDVDADALQLVDARVDVSRAARHDGH